MNDTRKHPRVDRRPAPLHNNTTQLTVGAIATLTALLVMGVFFWLMAATNSNDSAAPPAATETAAPPAPAPTAAAEPAPAPVPAPEATPPAPPSSRLSADEWLLSPYAILRQEGNLVIAGTLLNRAETPRSALIRVFVYAGGVPVAVGSTEVRDVPAGGTIELNMPSGSPWAGGEKILLVQADGLAE